MSDALGNIDLTALVQMLNSCDEIQLQGTPRLKIEKITWSSADGEPRFVITGPYSKVGSDLRAVWTGETWLFQEEGSSRLNTSHGKAYDSITDAYKDVDTARQAHPRYKAPKPVAPAPIDAEKLGEIGYARMAEVGRTLGIEGFAGWGSISPEIRGMWAEVARQVVQAERDSAAAPAPASV
jgi:hypothetical protein